MLDGAVGKGLEEARGRAPVVLGGNAPAGAVTVATMVGRLDPRGRLIKQPAHHRVRGFVQADGFEVHWKRGRCCSVSFAGHRTSGQPFFIDL